MGPGVLRAGGGWPHAQTMSLKWSHFPGLKEVKTGPVTSGVFVPVSAWLRAASRVQVQSILAASYGPPPRGGQCSPLAHAARVFQRPWSSCEGLHPVPRGESRSGPVCLVDVEGSRV